MIFQPSDTPEPETPDQTHNHERCDMDVLAIKDRERSVSITRAPHAVHRSKLALIPRDLNGQ